MRRATEQPIKTAMAVQAVPMCCVVVLPRRRLVETLSGELWVESAVLFARFDELSATLIAAV